MSARTSMTRILAGPDEWSRRRLQVLLGVALFVVAAVVAGIVWSVVGLLDAGAADDAPSTDPGIATSASAAAAPSIEDARPGPLSTGSGGTIRIPPPSGLGAVQVATDFPPSADGALAQLIAIDRRAVESGSAVTAQDVIRRWAAPGGPSPASWSGVAAVQTLLEAAGLPATGSTDLSIQFEPAMGLVQESGAETATVCVDFILTVTAVGDQPDRVAAADCQRMIWRGDRWVIASGAEAAPTPSLWPGTQASYDAGYQWLEVAP